MSTLAEVLAAHQWHGVEVSVCRCGLDLGDKIDAGLGHSDELMAEHQAEMVAAAGLTVAKQTKPGDPDHWATRLDLGMGRCSGAVYGGGDE